MPRYSHPHRTQAGFTLVELMVALGLSMLLAVALITLQVNLGKNTMRNADVGVRDTQARAALDLITQDLSGGGFAFGNSENLCNALITYNGSKYFVHHPVDSFPAVNGAAVSFAAAASALTLNYPTSTTIPSDVLVMTVSKDSTNFNSLTYPVINVSPNPAISPLNTNTIPLTSTTPTMAASDVAVLQVPMSGKLACLRIPLDVVTANVSVLSTGVTFPGYNSSTGFGSQMNGAGFAGSLTDADIYQSHLVDIGPTGTPTGQTVAYYVDNNSGSYPVLMRATYSLLDDSQIGTAQPVAAGVVSLQVRYGVDTSNTGVVTTPYLTAAQVTTAQQWDLVRSVRIAIISRSLVDDPDPTYFWSASASSPTPGASATATTAGYVSASAADANNNFADVPVPAGNAATVGAHRRYQIQQTEIAARDLMWSH